MTNCVCNLLEQFVMVSSYTSRLRSVHADVLNIRALRCKIHSPYNLFYTNLTTQQDRAGEARVMAQMTAVQPPVEEDIVTKKTR